VAGLENTLIWHRLDHARAPLASPVERAIPHLDHQWPINESLKERDQPKYSVIASATRQLQSANQSLE
jgi:hypothetical protein